MSIKLSSEVDMMESVYEFHRLSVEKLADAERIAESIDVESTQIRLELSGVLSDPARKLLSQKPEFLENLAKVLALLEIKITSPAVLQWISPHSLGSAMACVTSTGTGGLVMMIRPETDIAKELARLEPAILALGKALIEKDPVK